MEIKDNKKIEKLRTLKEINIYDDENKYYIDYNKLGKRLLSVTPEILDMSDKIKKENEIDKSLYNKYDVKLGLRDSNGKGVLAGLTKISDIQAKEIIDGVEVPCDGNLYYRGYNIKELVKGYIDRDAFGFEETAYLLLFGNLPTESELISFCEILSERRDLPPNFVRDVIMNHPSNNMMNNLARSILMLYSYDPLADDATLPNVLKQCLNIIGGFPRLMVYGYHAYKSRRLGDDLIIRSPRPELNTAENILYMLREDKKYTPLEARILDLALVLHMDHGGGNNSTFTTRVVSSSGTDTYSVIAAALGSLKGPKHGGANIKVVEMIEDLSKNVPDLKDDDQIKLYLEKVLDGQCFDKKGLIYGMGHAVYSVSDPRAVIFKEFVKRLAIEKGYEEKFDLYSRVERLAPEVIMKKKKMDKKVNANVDFYSGLVYNMLDLPVDIFTPLFATARVVGWSAHRLETLQNNPKIVRPAFKPAIDIRKYIPMEDR